MNSSLPRIDLNSISKIEIGFMCITRHPEKCAAHYCAITYNGIQRSGSLHWTHIAELISHVSYRTEIIFRKPLEHFFEGRDREIGVSQEPSLDNVLFELFNRVISYEAWDE